MRLWARLAAFGTLGLLVLPASAWARPTVYCGTVKQSEIQYTNLSISITKSAMDAIYRPARRSWGSRRAATCELASLIAGFASTPEWDTPNFNAHGESWYVGRYHCTFSKLIPANAPMTNGQAEEINGSEWAVCTHTGRYANQVRFMSTTFGHGGP